MSRPDAEINNGPTGQDSCSTGNGGFVSRLRALAIRGLRRMYLPDERLFVFRVRRTNDGIVSEGFSRRYTAIALIGLAGEEKIVSESVLAGQTLHAVCERVTDDLPQMTNLGDVALTLWAAEAIDDPNRLRIRDRLVEFKPAEGAYPVVEMAWALDALCVDRDAAGGGLRERLANRVISAFNSQSAVWPHIVKGNRGSDGMRSHLSCFADMVYPIHALSNYFKVSGDRRALDTAARCAEKICRLQGPAGQWWWHYDRRTGGIIEGYPVYAVHQDAMAPMALFALRDAGGPDFSKETQKGLDWLEHSPEINASLVDDDADVIWRKVARREPGKLSRYVRTMASRVHPALRVPGLDRLFPPRAVDYEDRPYHLGWLLYAWPLRRVARWEGRGVPG